MERGIKARAMMLVEPKHFTMTELPTQPVDRGGWLAVEATGISGADIQVWKGDARDVVYPLVPGHEVVGRIATEGPTIPFPIGTRVAVEPRIRCGECHRCKQSLATCVRRPTVELLWVHTFDRATGTVGRSRRIPLYRPRRPASPPHR